MPPAFGLLATLPRSLQNLRPSYIFLQRLHSHEAFAQHYSEHHVNLSSLQRILLTAGSASVSFLDPFRHDMIACFGETTGESALRYCLEQLQSTSEGSRILNEKPRINTSTINLSHLESLPTGTLGKIYSNFLVNVTPDSRAPVQFVDDLELAYVMQRYREVHDIFHAVMLMPTTMLGEVTIKWIEGLQLKLPMCITGGIFGAARLKPKQRKLYLDYYLPWALETGKKAKFLLGVYFEERWEQSLDEFHREMNIRCLI